MSSRVTKTEHAGPKKGRGAYWGPKKVAKAGSRRLRREQAKEEIRTALRPEASARGKAANNNVG